MQIQFTTIEMFAKRRLLFFISEKGGSEDGGYDRKRTDHGFN